MNIQNISELPPFLIPDFEVDINGNPFKYRENPKLKTKGVTLPFSKDHIDELIKCSNDIEYFADRYYKIVHQDYGLINIHLRDYQRVALSSFKDNRFNIIKYPRQSGKSTVFAAHVCHFILFNEYKNVIILANKEKQAKELLNRIKIAYQHLPYWLQQGIITWNKTEIELENGCKVAAASTSSDSVRGESVALLIVDECAHIDSTLWDQFWESVYPTISSAQHSKVILVSTPKGMNHFYKLWIMAKRGKNQFIPQEINWWDVPGYDEEWKKQTISNILERKFMQEYECKFLASTNSLVSAAVIENIPFADPVELKDVPIYQEIMKQNEYFENFMKIYKYPETNHIYSMGVDPAKITEESSGDSLAVQIIDVTEFPYDLCFTAIIPDKIHYLEVPEFLYTVGTWYNIAMMYVENNDSVGQEIADTLLLDYEYENIYSEKPGISGFRTTKKNKKIGCLNLKMLMEKEQMVVHDLDTISQLSTFVKTVLSYKADRGFNDDAVMSLIASLYFMQDRMYFEHKMGLISSMVNKDTPKAVKKLLETRQPESDPMPMTSSVFDDSQTGSVEQIFGPNSGYGKVTTLLQ